MFFPELPNLHALLILLLTAIALLLFSRDRIPLETSSLTILVALTLGLTLFPFQSGQKTLHAVDLFSGFGHQALVAVCALMVAGQGLVRTGALEPLGRLLSKLWGRWPQLSLLLTLVIAALLSAFVNNTPIVVLLLPILVSVAMRTKRSPSSVLMPMGLATLLGGMGTTIGTSTNLLVVSVASDMGLKAIGMFDFLLPAAIAGFLGIFYLWAIAPRLLPSRETPMSDVSPRVFAAELSITEESPLIGETLADVMKRTDGRLKVERVHRGSNTFLLPIPDVTLRSGDRLLVNDTPQQLKEFEQILGTPLYSGEYRVDEEHPLQAKDQQIAEVVVVRGSSVAGVSLRRARFVQRYNLVVLALHRQGRAVWPGGGNELADILLQVSDVLLVQGAKTQIAALKKDSNMLVLDATTDLPHTDKAPLALAIMAMIVILAALNILPIAISAVFGALMLILTQCLTWRDATSALSAQVILIVVASLALGNALLTTGGTTYITQVFLYLTHGAAPGMVLSGLMLLMAILTNIVSNNAAAVIGTPIAVSIAQQLGQPPEAFVLAVLFGANMSYATPMGYQTNLLVMNAGGYTFSDFLRIGMPLSLLMWLSLSFLLPLIYGF
ncbi:MAG: SLC13 family permease [Gammaproteobacteria bacterium]|nr:SLC13 family permease [Gammaproteobacteria bacterium]